MGGGLVRISDVRAAHDLPLWDNIDYMRRTLSSWRVDECLKVEDGMVVDGVELYWALKRLDVPLAPSSGDCSRTLDELDVYYRFSDNGRVYRSVVELVSRGVVTPLVRLRWSPSPGVRVWVKLEWYNPFSLSIKDRAALGIIESLGDVRGSTLFDASSSNFGAALAGLAVHYGARAKIYLPRNAEDFGRLAPVIMGSEVVATQAESTVQLIGLVARKAREEGGIHVNQFLNDSNFEAHLSGIAKEIDYQASIAGLKLAGVAGSLGTSGHMSAILFYLQSKYGGVEGILVQPEEGSNIPGIRRIETGMIWINMLDLDYRLVEVSEAEAAEGVVAIARSDGILIGPSGGAVVAALSKVAGSLKPGDYVAVIPDSGYKYISWISERAGIPVSRR